MLRIIALLGAAERAYGPLSRRSRRTRDELHLYPSVSTTSRTACYVVRRRATASLVRSRLVAIEGVPIERVLELVEPLRPARQPVEPPRSGAALRCSRPRCSTASGSPTASDARDVHVRAARRRARRRRADARRRVAVHVGGSPTRCTATTRRSCPRAARPLYLAGSAKAAVGADARGVVAPSTSATTPSVADARRSAKDRAARARLASVRRVIVDLRLNGGGDNTTYGPLTDALRLASGEHAGEALRAHRPRDVLRRRELRRRDRPRHAGASSSASRPAAASRRTATRSRFCSRRSAGPSGSPRGTTSASAAQERPPARGRARRSCRPHFEAVLRESRSRARRGR